MVATEADIAAGLRGLGLTGAQAEVHASFRSFGGVEGGVPAVAGGPVA